MNKSTAIILGSLVLMLMLLKDSRIQFELIEALPGEKPKQETDELTPSKSAMLDLIQKETEKFATQVGRN